MVGVLWLDTGDPNFGATIYSQDLYHATVSLLEMIPSHVSISILELDGNILAVLKYPMKSPMRDRFTIRKTDVVIRRYPLIRK